MICGTWNKKYYTLNTACFLCRQSKGKTVSCEMLTEQAGLSHVEKMEILAATLYEQQGKALVGINIEGLSSVADGLLLCTATTSRHAQALADYALEKAGERGMSYINMAGYKEGSWILIDFNDVVVSIFMADTRSYYNLEGLWPDAEIVDLRLPEDTDVDDDLNF